MRKYFYLLVCLLVGSHLTAQDDIYDDPEPVKPRVVYGNNSNFRNDGSYENIDESFNPDYDYRYRRSLRRMYDPYYIMPSSAFLNMYTYPQFTNFYNPYWGGGFTISIGNAWNNPWGWNSWNYGWNSWHNPWGWNSWNSWNAWQNPWGWNSWNSWNNPWCGWNSWGGGWNNPYWGGGWNTWGNGWNNPRWGGRGWSNNQQRNSVTPPERRIQRPVRVMDPNRDYGNTTYRPSNQPRNQGSSQQNNTPVYRGGGQSNTNSSPARVNPSPSRMGSMGSGSSGGSSSGNSGGGGGGSRSGGRSGGGGRF